MRTIRTASPRPAKIVVLDDDPTGSQEATNVPVVLHRDRARLLELLRARPSVYVLTNTRALSRADAVDLLEGIRHDIRAIEQELDTPILVVQRGDSTLRGHVFPEIEVFADSDRTQIVFAPAFPAGGRTTCEGVHTVVVDGVPLNAADTEFAKDPVFPFQERTLPKYVAARSSRPAVTTTARAFAAAAAAAPGNAVLIPDIVDASDVLRVAEGVSALVAEGCPPLVRCAAPLAAMIAGVKSSGYLDLADVRPTGPLLVVAGSHTGATTAQLAELAHSRPASLELDAEAAIASPRATAERAAPELAELLGNHDVVVLSTSRVRDERHGSLADGARVMDSLTSTVAAAANLPGVVIAKGGITSAEVARRGFGARTARVDGQVEAGISLWHLDPETRNLPYLVVPGNIGNPSTLRRLVGGLVNLIGVCGSNGPDRERIE